MTHQKRAISNGFHNRIVFRFVRIPEVVLRNNACGINQYINSIFLKQRSSFFYLIWQRFHISDIDNQALRGRGAPPGGALMMGEAGRPRGWGGGVGVVMC